MKKPICLLIALLAVVVGIQSSAEAVVTPFILYGPLVEESALSFTQITLSNPGTTASTADVRYYNGDGTLATTENYIIPGKGQIVFPTAPASVFWTGIRAAVEVEVTDGPNLLGLIIPFNKAADFATSTLMTPTVATDLYAPRVLFGSGSLFEGSCNLQNPTTSPVSATVNFYNPDGSFAVSDDFVLAPHGSQLIDFAVYGSFWAGIEAAVEVNVTAGTGLTGSTFNGDLIRFTGELMATSLDTELFTPILLEGLSYTSFLMLQNPSTTTSSGTIDFYRNTDGALMASSTFSMAPHAIHTVNTGSFFTGTTANAINVNAKVIVTSGPGIHAEAVLFHPDQAGGHPMVATAETELVGMTMRHNQFIASFLALQNPSDLETVSALLTFYNNDGTTANTDTITLTPNSSTTIAAATYSALWAGDTTSVNITVTAGPGLTGVMLRQDPVLGEWIFSDPATPPPPAGGGTPPPPVDTDGDGVFDDVDACPNMAGRPEWDGAPSAIFVKAKKHKIHSTTTFPTVEDQILNGLNVYLYPIDHGSIPEDDDEEDDSVGTSGGHSLKWKDFATIVATVTPIAVKQIDENGTILFGVCPGKYLLIGEQADGTLVGKKVGHVRSGKLKKKKLKMLLINNKKRPGKHRRRHGSNMWIIEPAVIDWTATTEYYPFVFETTGSWNTSIQMYPPAGFVSDFDTIAGSVDDVQRCFQFEVTDVGSLWVPTDVVLTFDHLGTTEVMQDQIDVINSIQP